MIDYDAKGFIGIIFRLRGSLFPQLVPRIAVVTGVGAFTAWVEQHNHFSLAQLPYFQTPMHRVVRSRLSWLVLLFVAETAAGTVWGVGYDLAACVGITV